MALLTSRIRAVVAAATHSGFPHDGRKLRHAAAVVALASAALVAPVAAPAATAAEPVLTDFSLAASGFSTEVNGGALPVQSGRTGVAGLACTRFANLSTTNNTAAIGIPEEQSLVQVGATRTRATTSKQAATVSSYAQNDVASVVVGNKAVAALEIDGIQTRARAWHNASGYHRNQVVQVAGVTRWVAGEPEQVASIPLNQDLNGQQLRIPGLAAVTFGLKGGFANSQSASATATAITIDLELTNTEVVIGHAQARIEGGAIAGIMSGSVWGSQLTGLGGIVNSGRTALLGLACLGTDGQYAETRVAALSIPGVVSLGEVVSRVRGSQGGGEASAQGISTVAAARFLGRGLQITAIRAQALVRRASNGSYTRNASGTTIGSIVLAGRRLPLPVPGRTLVIPGVARLTRGVVVRTGVDAIKVVGLRVQLLEGSRIESTLDLANVRLQVRRG